jgi:hypothetical protein
MNDEDRQIAREIEHAAQRIAERMFAEGVALAVTEAPHDQERQSLLLAAALGMAVLQASASFDGRILETVQGTLGRVRKASRKTMADAEKMGMPLMPKGTS